MHKNLGLKSENNSLTFFNNYKEITLNLNSLRYSIKNLKTKELIADSIGFELCIKKGKYNIYLKNEDFKYCGHKLKSSSIPKNKGKSLWVFLKSSYSKIDSWLVFDLSENKTFAAVKFGIKNKTETATKILTIKPFIAKKEILQDSKIFYNGYISLGMTRAFGTKEREFRFPLRLAQYMQFYKTKISAKRDEKITSNGFAVITEPNSKKSITLGFTDFASQHGEVHVGENSIEAVSWFDGKHLEHNNSLESSSFYIQDENNYPFCLDEYSELVSSYMKPLKWRYTPFGYCTWYYYFSGITEEETLKNLEFISNTKKNPYFKIDYYQLDDGYLPAVGQYGEWKKVHPEKFPDGLGYIASEISKKGFIPGLWIAPFNVASDTEVAIKHPKWLLQDENNKPKIVSAALNRVYYGLDPTHPEAKEYLQSLFEYIRGFGFRYVKIDFVYTSTVDNAIFFDKKATRPEAYREGLKAIRKGLGDDVFLLGCNAPIMESIGCVNGMRIGSDTNSKWLPIARLISRFNITFPSVKYALLNTITRSWMHKKFWINDPDCLILRTGKNLKGYEVQTEVSVLGLSCGQVAVSENLEKLTKEEFRMASLVYPQYDKTAYSPDLFENEYPEIYMAEGDSKIHGNWKVSCIINWLDKKRDFEIRLSRFNCDAEKKYHIFDFWCKKYLGVFKGDEILKFKDVLPHGCKLLRITEDEEKPLILGTTLHILQGAVEVKNVCIKNNNLILELLKYGLNEGQVIIKLPDKYSLGINKERNYETSRISENIYCIDVRFVNELSLKLKTV